MSEKQKCPNCGEEGFHFVPPCFHFVPPCFGEQGFYICDEVKELKPVDKSYIGTNKYRDIDGTLK